MALSLKTALAIHAWVATSCAQSSAGPAPSMSVSYSTNAGVTLGMDGVTMATGMPSLVSVCPDKSSTRTFVVDADRAGATFSATSPVGSYTLKYSGAGPALAGLDMTLSFTSNASAMAKPQDLWFLPLASGGWCYHTQQDGKWAPDTTGPWSFPHYGEDTPGGSLDLGYPLPGGRGTPGLMPGPQVHFAEWAESSIVSVLPANPANTSWGWFSWGPYKWRSMLVLAAVEPGETRTVKFALRAGPGNSSSIPPTSVAQDAYANFGKLHPLQHKWPDRRPIAMVMTGIHGIDAYNRTTNPHSYDTGQPKPFDMTTAEGRAYFKTSLIAFAHQIVAVEKQRGEYAQSQGVIVWDIEGEGDPWATYDGSPNMLPQIAPEMDAVADEFMAVFNDAGLRVGVCIRPQQLTRVPNYDPSNPKSEPWEQIDLERPDNSTDNEAITKLLAEKIAYANKRWNATLFYTDSTINRNGILDVSIFEAVVKQFPEVLIMPEESTFPYNRFVSPLCNSNLGCTSPGTNATWGRDAFHLNLMQHVPPTTDAVIRQYAEQVYRGDVLLDMGWFYSDRSKLIRAAYELAYNGSMGPVPPGCVGCPGARQQ